MRLRRAVLVLATVAFAIAAPLGASAAASPSSATASTGSIAGHVTGVGGTPIDGACVSLRGGVPTPETTNSGADGAYEFDDLPASPSDGFYIVVDPACSSDPLRDDYLTYRSNMVYVTAATTVAVDAPLSLGGSVTGTVVDSNSDLLAGACVAAYPSTGDTSWAYGYTQTASDGSYVLRGIPPGDYVVEIDGCYSSQYTGPDIQAEYYDAATATGTTQDPGSASVLTISPGIQQDLRDVQTEPAGDIVLSVQSIAVGDLWPSVISLAAPTGLGSYAGFDGPDANGDFRITHLTPGTYDIGYNYCPSSCRLGYIGYYKHAGLDGEPTAVTVTAGNTLQLQDTVDVPPMVDTTTTLSPLPSHVAVGQSMTLKIKVTQASGTHIPSGWADVYEVTQDGADPPVGGGAVELDASGEATVAWTALPGVRTIVASYRGDGGSNSSQTQIVITDGVAPGGSGSSGGGSGGGAPPVSSPVSGTVAAGGSLSSDPAGTTPDASNPLVVGVTTPTGGAVSIDKTAPNTTVSHYSVLNVGATITAPAATSTNPLKLSFQVFDGQLPQGSYASDLTVFRDGVPVGACAKAGTAAPDPCVTSTSTSNGVTTINILSSHASTWDVEAAHVGRIGGADRVGTAVAVSRDSFPAGNAGAVVLARADDYPDALVGGPLAAAKNAPLLLTQGAQLPKATSDEITRVLPAGGTVYVLGGPAAVPDSVVSQLKSLGFSVVREAGADRYATAVAVANELGDPGTVLLATGTNFPDALAAGPAAAHLRGVVLLTAGAVLPKATSDYLAAHATSTYAVGGPAAMADPAATALVGADRFATATTVANTLFASPPTVGIATGQAFPDALSGGAQLALADAPLLLVATSSVPATTSGYLTAAGANLRTVHLFGGPAALTDTVVAQLQALTS